MVAPCHQRPKCDTAKGEAPLPSISTRADPKRQRSEGAVRLFKKLDFLSGRASSKDRVPMGKAPKSVDNRLVSFRPLLQIMITEARHQRDRASLHLAIL